MTEIPDKKYFRTDELAEEFGVCVETVRRWIRDRKVIVLRYGHNSIKIPRTEFIYILENGPRKRKL